MTSQETLAHLVVCLEICVAQVEAILAKKPFELTQGKDLDAQLVEAGRLPVDDLVRRLKAADERLRHFGRALDPQNMMLEVWRLELKRGSMWLTLDDVILWLARRIRSRQRKLARASTT